MAKDPLVSVIVPTRNSQATLGSCLRSIKEQTYQNIELIVVDRDSTDDTKAIARQFTQALFNHGPERSAQRNLGVAKATGHYVALIDSDMELTPQVIAACVGRMTKDPTIKGVIIPEESFGDGFWAQCKALERSFYVGQPGIEAARFLSRDSYNQLGGYDESLVAGEDWDLSARLSALGAITSIPELIRHNEGRINLRRTLKKKFYYARHAQSYFAKHPESKMISASTGPLARYKLFLSHPRKLFRHPLVGFGMLFMKTTEYAAVRV